MKEKRKSKAGRNPKLDPAVYRYTVRFNEEEHNRFLAMFGKSGVYARSVFLKAHFFGQAKTKGLHLFWTMVDGRERNDLYGIYEEVIAEMGFPVLSTRLPDSKKFRRDLSEERKSVFRSTIFPMDTALLKGSGIREFSEEISDIIRPQ